jgi:hypothetical protein
VEWEDTKTDSAVRAGVQAIRRALAIAAPEGWVRKELGTVDAPGTTEEVRVVSDADFLDAALNQTLATDRPAFEGNPVPTSLPPVHGYPDDALREVDEPDVTFTPSPALDAAVEHRCLLCNAAPFGSERGLKAHTTAKHKSHA